MVLNLWFDNLGNLWKWWCYLIILGLILFVNLLILIWVVLVVDIEVNFVNVSDSNFWYIIIIFFGVF